MSLLERLGDKVPVLRRLPLVGSSSREIPREIYLATLPVLDQSHVKDYVAFLQERRTNFQDLRVGVLAFGSSVKPEALRHHLVDDIDLRVITSATAHSEAQISAIATAIGLTDKFLEENKYKVDYYPTHSRIVKMCSYNPETGQSKTETGPFFVDYSNNDPSFVAKAAEGLPLHISISGPGEETLDLHLREEERQRQYFSVLGLF